MERIQIQSQSLFDFGSFMCKNTSESYCNSFTGSKKLPNVDNKIEDLVHKPDGFRKKDKLETKKSAASRSHCEAERRRRERINGHFAALRALLPYSDNVKMDKATLLANVISHVKVLKIQATEATNDVLVPTNINEVIVVPYYHEPIEDGCLVFQASICCRYDAKLIRDIRQAINNLKLTITKAEISTLEERVKNVLIISGYEDDIGCENRGQFAKLIQEELCSVLEKSYESDELSTMIVMNKRQRVSYCEPSTSSL